MNNITLLAFFYHATNEHWWAHQNRDYPRAIRRDRLAMKLYARLSTILGEPQERCWRTGYLIPGCNCKDHRGSERRLMLSPDYWEQSEEIE